MGPVLGFHSLQASGYRVQSLSGLQRQTCHHWAKKAPWCGNDGPARMSKQEGLLPRQGGDSEYSTRWPVGWNGFHLSSRRWLTVLSSTAVLCRHCGRNRRKSSPLYPDARGSTRRSPSQIRPSTLKELAGICQGWKEGTFGNTGFSWPEVPQDQEETGLERTPPSRRKGTRLQEVPQQDGSRLSQTMKDLYTSYSCHGLLALGRSCWLPGCTALTPSGAGGGNAGARGEL